MNDHCVFLMIAFSANSSIMSEVPGSAVRNASILFIEKAKMGLKKYLGVFPCLIISEYGVNL